MTLNAHVDATMDFTMADATTMQTDAIHAQSGISETGIEYPSDAHAYMAPDISPSSVPSLTTTNSTRQSPAKGLVDESQLKDMHSSPNSALHLKWPCFQCNPPFEDEKPSRKPRDFVENLRTCLQNPHDWESRNIQSTSGTKASKSPSVAVRPLTSTARDRLIILLQGILHRGLDATGTPQSGGGGEPHTAKFPTFVMLPSSLVLDHYLQLAFLQDDSYFKLNPGRSFDASQLLMHSDDEEVTGLFILLLVAQGAQYVNTSESRTLTSGLVELGRFIFQDRLDRGDTSPTNPQILHCSLLLLQLTAWSGNLWQMSVNGPDSDVLCTMLILIQTGAAFWVNFVKVCHGHGLLLAVLTRF
jgi:hypothetical protein